MQIHNNILWAEQTNSAQANPCEDGIVALVVASITGRAGGGARWV